MTAGRVILWRHGQTDYNIGGRVQGQVDIPLNATGWDQVRTGAQLLAAYLGGATVRIISSDLSRAQDTAAALASLLEVPVESDARLRERAFGVWEEKTRDEIVEGWGSELIEQWSSGLTPSGIGMEPKREVAARVAAVIREEAAKLEPEVTLVAVGHGAALSQGATLLLGFDPEAGSPIRGLDNCHFTDLAHQPTRKPEWALRAHNLG